MATSTPEICSRLAVEAHSSSIWRMNAGTPASIAPGVSVVGIITCVICSSSANCSALIVGPADCVSPGDLREKRVSAPAPPKSTTAPSSKARRFTFPSVTDTCTTF